MVLPACDPREPSVHIPPLAGSSATFIKPPGSSQTPVLPSSMAHCILNTSPHYNVHDPTLQQMHSLDHFPGSACSGDCHGQYHLPRQNRGAPGHSVLYKARLHTDLLKQLGKCHHLPSLTPTCLLRRTASQVLRRFCELCMLDLLSSVIDFLQQFTLKCFLFWQGVQHHATPMPCLITSKEQKNRPEKWTKL